MRRNAMPVGAALMDRWFAGQPRVMSDAEKRGGITALQVNRQFVDTTTVTMAWALSHARARQAADRLLRTWTAGDRRGRSGNRIAQIVRDDAARTPRGATYRFGDLRRPVTEIDTHFQVNFERVESSFLGTVDDFYAALGAASIKLAVSGVVTRPSETRGRIVVDQIGLYLRDTYDFNGDQPLGSWGPDGMSRVAVLAPDIAVTRDEFLARHPRGVSPGQAYWGVDNGSFQRHRRLVRRGGDFLIFSDVQTQALNPGLAVEFDW